MSEWKPHLRQEAVISAPDTIFEKFYGGAAGGGKTEIGIVYPLVKRCKFSDRMWYQHPKFKGLIIRRTIPELKKELVRRCQDYYTQTGGDYNKADRVWNWPWGAQMWLSAAEHEDDIRKYDTEQFTYIFFEELTSFTEFQYVYLTFSRCRPADEDLPGCVLSASNPGNVGHGWVRKRFVEPAKEGGQIIRQYFYDKDGSLKLDESGKPKYTDRIYIRALGSDNPHLLKNDPNYLTKLENLPEAEKAAKLYGDWWTYSGQVFDSFRSKKYPDEPDNAIHVIPAFQIPDWWPRILMIDWGFRAATEALWAAISPDKRCYIYREYYARETTIDIWATEIGELSRGENLRSIGMDTNAWDVRGEERTIAEQFQTLFNRAANRTDLALERANKSRISGKILVQEFLRWKPKPQIKSEFSVDEFDAEIARRLRYVSEDAYLTYVRKFEPSEPEKNIPRLQIFEGAAPKLVECIPLCVYDDKDVEDVKEWQASVDTVGDDPYDCLRYLLKRVDRYVREAANEMHDREAEQKIVEQFHQDNNVTGYYRRMELHERHHRIKRGSVKRISRIRRVVH